MKWLKLPLVAKCGDVIRAERLKGRSCVRVLQTGERLPIPKLIDGAKYVVACCRGISRDRDGNEQYIIKATITLCNLIDKRRNVDALFED